jgi:hypothetical protein
MMNVQEIAPAPWLVRLLFGTVDFRVDLAIEDDGDDLDSYRSLLALLSRAAGARPLGAAAGSPTHAPPTGVPYFPRFIDIAVASGKQSAAVGFFPLNIFRFHTRSEVR